VTVGGDFEVNEAIQKSRDELTKQLAEAQKQYRSMFDQMSLLKNDIDQVQKLIQQNRAKLVKDFEQYQKKKEKVKGLGPLTRCRVNRDKLRKS
jgi:flagellar biosynthesis chaperone FliJ